MSRITWNAVGRRFYEIGVDRGVLYIDGVGYGWSGLVSVDETPSGGEAKAYYIDGVKYLNLSAKEEFEATISAFFSPPEFDACDGVRALRVGLYAGQQRRKQFGLSYRTGIGNDLDGMNHGYKIHIVYNALVTPTHRNGTTMSDSPDPSLLSWSITTMPILLAGKVYSSHFIVDTRDAPSYSVEMLETILYGNEREEPRLPDPAELLALFPDLSDFIVMDITNIGDGKFAISGSDLAVQQTINPSQYLITSDTVVMIDEHTAQISST